MPSKRVQSRKALLNNLGEENRCNLDYKDHQEIIEKMLGCPMRVSHCRIFSAGGTRKFFCLAFFPRMEESFGAWRWWDGDGRSGVKHRVEGSSVSKGI